MLKRCQTDFDCPSGQTCNPASKTCSAISVKTTFFVPTTPNYCTQDSQCSSNQFCLMSSNRCLEVECLSQSECRAGFTCDMAQKRCVGTLMTQNNECSSTRPCLAPNQRCSDGVCRGINCSKNSDCPGPFSVCNNFGSYGVCDIGNLPWSRSIMNFNTLISN